MSDTLTLPDGLVVPSRGHAADCDVFFAPARGCSCAVAREIRMTRERDEALARVAALEAALDRDRTGLAAALASVVREVQARRWIAEGRGPYEWDDDRYREETGAALNAIDKIARDGLAESGRVATAALSAPGAASPAGKGGAK